MRARPAWCVPFVLVIACSGPTESDGGGVGDAATSDAGSSDAGSTDAATRMDAGALADGGDPTDAGDLIDAGSMDAGSSDAGSSDAGSSDAGSSDAGGRDAGSDAGSDATVAITTCSIRVTPMSGALSDTFTFTAASNGSACTVTLDGATMLSVPCAAMMDLSGATFGVGTHTVELAVGAGPGGPTTCRTSFQVIAGPTDAGVADAGPPMDAGSLTTCAIDVTPPAGSTSTTFTATWASTGTGCTLSVDSLSLGTMPCTGSFSGPGSAIGPGSHTAILDVAGGPSGATSCSDGFTVTP